MVRNRVIRKLRRIQLALQGEQLHAAECGVRLIKELLFTKGTVYFSFSFQKKNLNKAKHSIYGHFLPVFSTNGSRFEEK